MKKPGFSIRPNIFFFLLLLITACSRKPEYDEEKATQMTALRAKYREPFRAYATAVDSVVVWLNDLGAQKPQAVLENQVAMSDTAWQAVHDLSPMVVTDTVMGKINTLVFPLRHLYGSPEHGMELEEGKPDYRFARGFMLTDTLYAYPHTWPSTMEAEVKPFNLEEHPYLVVYQVLEREDAKAINPELYEGGHVMLRILFFDLRKARLMRKDFLYSSSSSETFYESRSPHPGPQTGDLQDDLLEEQELQAQFQIERWVRELRNPTETN